MPIHPATLQHKATAPYLALKFAMDLQPWGPRLTEFHGVLVTVGTFGNAVGTMSPNVPTNVSTHHTTNTSTLTQGPAVLSCASVEKVVVALSESYSAETLT